MPVVLTLGAIAIVAILIVLGWRQRWDPTPQPLPPVTLKTIRESTGSAKLPRWYWALGLGSYVLMILMVLLSVALHREWIADVGFGLFLAGLLVRLAAPIWITAQSRSRRVAAIARPSTLLLLGGLAAASGSLWWLLPGVIVYAAILPLSDAYERRRREKVGQPPAAPGPGDTRR